MIENPWEDFNNVREVRVATHEGRLCMEAIGPRGYMFRRFSVFPEPVDPAKVEAAAVFLNAALAEGKTIAPDFWHICGAVEGSPAAKDMQALAEKLIRIAEYIQADLELLKMEPKGADC